ncbi:MAG: MetQ/NlpA family ABC transporter substrate-binding protein [Clostridia bacterium]|nr:MetQ/NlpA family ABC transporter substrate-binding protein [Clostridia bacterium]
MKKFLSVVLALVLTLSLASSALAVTVALPNDATNEGRALLLLQANGIITLKEEAGITATVADIAENPLGLEFHEVEAAMVPNVLADVDYAIINNNFALDAGLNPADGSLLKESADSPYANVLSVKDGNQDTDACKALIAALSSQAVADYIAANWADGSVVSVIAEPGDGYDATVDYAALAGTTIKVGATPNPHELILTVVKDILAAKDITLEIVEYTDYILPNEALEAGDLFANYFAHTPYQDDFNANNGTHIVNVLGVHVEPMALYGGKQADLTALTVK